MKPSHYLIIFTVGVIAGWSIYQLQHRNTPTMYDHPTTCEILGKNHPYCKK